ncbi:hypothetical protein PsorP6_000766 [Peronosclerospora sorghi]|uniref:Uncharacterized protein n=1 Tax=Peronosclerospora sorghi TaxID=230839 RepID=A0ACC0WY43_9STRA|nr:hypothetical protein PsorP6_000766 [Peronosclerospora sorghi]
MRRINEDVKHELVDQLNKPEYLTCQVKERLRDTQWSFAVLNFGKTGLRKRKLDNLHARMAVEGGEEDLELARKNQTEDKLIAAFFATLR